MRRRGVGNDDVNVQSLSVRCYNHSELPGYDVPSSHHATSLTPQLVAYACASSPNGRKTTAKGEKFRPEVERAFGL